eukprot:CAMPEP_0204515548 /NCGR_PEP_ID=MMETSP0661-20131031/2680_1 /ASSEMBLY_ACC=CAM_ASM_000606 /TAXON_ID=109239 /ORGANISM="Alexandrium margalefi, Strain AMGDE01CS-322" /LENGTH=55 /DNA_ID=CAMNT_0051520871 /DNA_START=208 /DNA_END=372 /DNA_ORIENTATION=-
MSSAAVGRSLVSSFLEASVQRSCFAAAPADTCTEPKSDGEKPLQVRGPSTLGEPC